MRSKFVTEADGLKLGTTILQMIRPRFSAVLSEGGLVPSFEYPEHAIDLPTAPPEWVDVPPGADVARLAVAAHASGPGAKIPAQNMFLVLKGRDRVQYLEPRLLIHKHSRRSPRNSRCPGRIGTFRCRSTRSASAATWSR